jgi:threonylcarbamoyladenosine tRNA methylthiotransferase MtaB
MRQLGAEKKEQFYQTFRGRRMAVLIEEKIDRGSGGRRGFTRNYLPIIVTGANHRVNEEVDVQIQGFAGGCLTGAAIYPGACENPSETRA